MPLVYGCDDPGCRRRAGGQDGAWPAESPLTVSEAGREAGALDAAAQDLSSAGVTGANHAGLRRGASSVAVAAELNVTHQIQGLQRTAAILPVLPALVQRVDDQKLQRCSHRCVTQLKEDLKAWVEACNADLRPYKWVKKRRDIFDSSPHCQRVSGSGALGHQAKRMR
jgi:hypothetical protein